MNDTSVQLLQKHFDTALESPDGIKKLRELILMLAMQGKLVKQDPKDQPACELLKDIQLVKERLFKEGKIKRLKELPPIKPEDVPYVAPEGWFFCRFNEVNTVKSELVQSKDYPNEKQIGPDSIEKDRGRLLFTRTVAEFGAIGPNNRFYKGQLLYSKIRPSLNKAVIAPYDGLCSADMYPVETSINIEFLLRLILSEIFLSQVRREENRVKMPKLNLESLYSFIIPIPPLAEQKRIVTKIDELMALCDKMEAQRNARNVKRQTVNTAAINRLMTAVDKKDFATSWQFITRHFDPLYSVKENVAALKKAILTLAMQGKLVKQDPKDQPASELLKEIQAEKERLVKEDGLRTTASQTISENEKYLKTPDDWEYVRLGNISKFIDYRGRTPVKVSSGVPLITAKNIRFGYIDREPYEYITEEDYEAWMTRGIPRIGDLLFTTEAPLGNIAIINIEEKFGLAQRAICFQLHNSEMAHFIRYLVMSDIFQEQLLLNATGMTAKGIKASRLKEIPIPLPPLAEQKRIVAKIDELIALCDNMEKQIDLATEKQTALFDAVLAGV